MFVDEESRSIRDSSAGSAEDEHVTENVTPVLHNEDYVYLGGKKYLKNELMYAFGGTFNPGVHVAPRLQLGNPTPMGLFSFATTTFILSLINAGSRGVAKYEIVLGCGLFYGGIVQIIAGLWELLVENTFGATVFTAYGGFWLAFAVMTMDGFNIASAYTDPKEYYNAQGLFFTAWVIVTLFFFMMTLRSTIGMFVLLLSLLVTFILLTSSKFILANGNDDLSSKLQIAGGVFGCFTSMLGYYNGLAGILTKENSWISIRPIFMPGAIRPEQTQSKSKAKAV